MWSLRRTGKRQSLDVGEHEVQDDRVIAGGPDEGESLLAVGGKVHGVSLALEAAANNGGEVLFVIHDEKAQSPSHPSVRPATRRPGWVVSALL